MSLSITSSKMHSLGQDVIQQELYPLNFLFLKEKVSFHSERKYAPRTFNLLKSIHPIMWRKYLQRMCQLFITTPSQCLNHSAL